MSEFSPHKVFLLPYRVSQLSYLGVLRQVLFTAGVKWMTEVQRENMAHMLASMHLVLRQQDGGEKTAGDYGHVTNTTYEKFVERLVDLLFHSFIHPCHFADLSIHVYPMFHLCQSIRLIMMHTHTFMHQQCQSHVCSSSVLLSVPISRFISLASERYTEIDQSHQVVTTTLEQIRHENELAVKLKKQLEHEMVVLEERKAVSFMSSNIKCFFVLGIVSHGYIKAIIPKPFETIPG